jgi:hypothetical protein
MANRKKGGCENSDNLSILKNHNIDSKYETNSFYETKNGDNRSYFQVK